MKHFFTLFLGLLAALTPLSTHAITVNDLCPFTDASTGLKWGYGMQCITGNEYLVDGYPTNQTGVGKWVYNQSTKVLNFQKFQPYNDGTDHTLSLTLNDDGTLTINGFAAEPNHIILPYSKITVYSNQTGYKWNSTGTQCYGKYTFPYVLQYTIANSTPVKSSPAYDFGEGITQFEFNKVAITYDAGYDDIHLFEWLWLYAVTPDAFQSYTLGGSASSNIPAELNLDFDAGKFHIENFLNKALPCQVYYDQDKGGDTFEEFVFEGTLTKAADGSYTTALNQRFVYGYATQGTWYRYGSSTNPSDVWWDTFIFDPSTYNYNRYDYFATAQGTFKPYGTPSHFTDSNSDLWIGCGGTCETKSQGQFKFNDFYLQKRVDLTNSYTNDQLVQNYQLTTLDEENELLDWTLELTLSNVSIQLLNLPGESGKIHITADYQLGGYFGWFDSLELFAYPARVTSVAGRADLNASTGITGAINLSAAASGSSTSSGSSAGGTIRRAMPSIRANSPSSGTITLDVPEDAFPNGANFDAPVTLFAKVNYSIPNDLEPTFHALSVVTPRVPSGIDTTEFDLAQPAQYFDLQGRPVAAPVPDQLLLKRQGTTVTKVRF